MKYIIRFLVLLVLALLLLFISSGAGRAYISWKIEKDGAVLIKALEAYKSEHGVYPQDQDLSKLRSEYTGEHRFSSWIEWRFREWPEGDGYFLSTPSWIRVTKSYNSLDKEWDEMYH